MNLITCTQVSGLFCLLLYIQGGAEQLAYLKYQLIGYTSNLGIHAIL